MAEEGTAKVGIVIEADDRTKAGFSSASKGADNLKKKFAGLKSEASGLPEKFSKATAALFLFQGGLGRAGGAAADVANKVVAVAALMVTGGPLGIALAVVTGLLAAASAAWEHFGSDAAKAAEIASKAADVLKKKIGEIGDAAAAARAKTDGMIDDAIAGGDALRKQYLATRIEIDKLTFNMQEMGATEKILARSTIGNLKIQLGLIKSKIELEKKTAKEAERARRRADEAAALDKAFSARQSQLAAEAALRVDAYIDADQARADSAKAAAGEIIDAEAMIARFRADAFEKEQIRIAAFNEAQAVARDEATAAAIAQTEKQIDLLEQSTTAAGDAFGAYVSGSASADEAMAQLTSSFSKMLLQMAIDRVKAAALETAAETAKSSTVITASAAEGAAKAGAAHAGIPFVGLAVGLAAAIAMQAMIGKFASFHSGGMVTGGRPGVDSVPAMLEQGEFVLPTDTVNRIKGQPRGNSTTNNNNNAQSITLNVQSRPGQSFSYRDIRGLDRELADVQRRAISRGGMV